MRVLHISDAYLPRIGGLSTSIGTTLAALEDEGIDTVLIAPSYDRDTRASPLQGANPYRSGRIVRVPARGVPVSSEDRLMRWRALGAALDSLASEKFDIVHVHTPFMAHRAGIAFARRLGILAVATYHTLFGEYASHYIPGLPRALGLALAAAHARYQAREYRAIVAPSPGTDAMLRSFGVRAPIFVIPTGLPASAFVPGDAEAFRKAHRIGSDRRILLYAGRVAREKSLPFLIDVLARVRIREPRALLAIAGDGPARAAVEANARALGAASHVRWCGYLDRESHLRDAYAAASAFVFASSTETQGLAMLEAMAQGAPVIARDMPGADPRCPAIIVERDLGPFTSAVLEILKSPELKQSRRIASIQFAQLYSSRNMGRALAALYRSLT